MSERQFPTTEALDESLCQAISERLEEALQRRGAATLVISGGSTPAGLYRKLARSVLPWNKITVLLADDRWVAGNHRDSNEGMVRELLLQDHAADAHLLSLSPDFPDEGNNLVQVERLVSQLPTFDVVLLGMGLDGHTASLFPCSAEITHVMTTTDSVAMTQPTTAPHRRISLTRKRLEDSRWGALHIVGGDKLKVVKSISSTTAQTEIPVSAFLPPRGKFDIWYAP